MYRWKYHWPCSSSVGFSSATTRAPREITSLFNGSRQVVYGFVPHCTEATLEASIAGQAMSTMVSTSQLSITKGLTVHRMAARAIIRDIPTFDVEVGSSAGQVAVRIVDAVSVDTTPV